MPIHLPPLTRREFLAGSLAAAGSAAVPQTLRADEPVDRDRFILMADSHVWEFRDREYRKTVPTANFIEAVRQIVALRPRPAGVMLAGDCVHLVGNAADYTVLAAEVKPLRAAGLSVSLSLGNHDHREHFWDAFPEVKPNGAPPVETTHVAVVETPRANFFLLDSLNKTNITPGLLDEKQIAWLAKELDARADKPAIIVAHHDPQRDLPKISGLLDTKAFYDVIVPRKQVKAYVFGHTHRWGVTKHEGIHLVNLPPTAWVFDATQPRGWVDLRLSDGGMTLILNTLEGKHEKHGEKAELTYRT